MKGDVGYFSYDNYLVKAAEVTAVLQRKGTADAISPPADDGPAVDRIINMKALGIIKENINPQECPAYNKIGSAVELWAA